jgi:hypothetical protein
MSLNSRILNAKLGRQRVRQRALHHIGREYGEAELDRQAGLTLASVCRAARTRRA